MNYKEIFYWSESKEKVLSLLGSSPGGLSSAEAKKRKGIYGLNVLSRKQKSPLIISFLAKFFDPLILLLLAACVISGLVSSKTNFGIILLLVFVSVTVDFFQEWQAQNAVEKLRKKVSSKASVLRDGGKRELYFEELVPGDIIFLSAGDVVPADGLLINSNDLLVDESVLTGEPFPQEKVADKTFPKKSSISQLTNCVFMGTHVISGEGMFVMTRAVGQSELGKVAKELVVARPETEFHRGIRSFGLMVTRVVLIAVVFVFIVNVLIRHEVLNPLLFALAIAIGMAPELLPVILTINLSKGALKMAKLGVIVKDLASIQNFGSMQILCTDKTGTFTEGKTELDSFENAKGEKERKILLYAYISSFYQSGLKSLMSQAIIKFVGGEFENLKSEYKKIDEVPFDFTRRRLSIICQHDQKKLLITQGAPEGTLSLCESYLDGEEIIKLTGKEKDKLLNRFESLSQQGNRVLAVAERSINKDDYGVEDERKLVFLGFLIFSDLPKKSAKEAFEKLVEYGVQIKILTGDNELVTQKVCEEIGLPLNKTILGSQIDELNDEQLKLTVQDKDIFARLNPQQKERIILALKKDGKVVGFLGDGINDAPSLRAADIGISVDNAVDVTRESADFILLRKDLLVLKEGIREGRKTHGNIMKYIMMGTSSDFGNMISVASASLFLPFLPMLPAQIFLNDLLYDVTQFSISSDQVDEAYLKKPKKWDVGFIKKFMLIFGLISSLFDFLAFFLFLYFFHFSSSLFQTGWFVVSITTQTLIVLSIRTITFPFFKSKPSKYLFAAILLIVGLAWFLPLSPIARNFSFSAPPLSLYLLIIPIVIVYFILVELTKRWFYKKYVI